MFADAWLLLGMCLWDSIHVCVQLEWSVTRNTVFSYSWPSFRMLLNAAFRLHTLVWCDKQRWGLEQLLWAQNPGSAEWGWWLVVANLPPKCPFWVDLEPAWALGAWGCIHKQTWQWSSLLLKDNNLLHRWPFPLMHCLFIDMMELYIEFKTDTSYSCFFLGDQMWGIVKPSF